MKRLLFLFPFFCAIQLSAQTFQWQYSIDSVVTFSSPKAADLNSDGVDDVVMGSGLEQKTKTGVLAIDGKNGALLWSQTAENELFSSAIFGNLNSDNTSDVVMSGRGGEFFALDGENGKVLWEFLNYSKKQAADSGWYNFFNAQWLPDQNQDNVQDLLISNGGDKSKSYTDTIGRPAGKLLLVSGADGKLIQEMEMPDGTETYMSPMIYDFNKDSELEIIFGSGGETMSGSLYHISLKDLLGGKSSKAVRLKFIGGKGFIPPGSIADFNGDGYQDVAVQAYNADIYVFSGKDMSLLWKTDFTGFETQCTPAVGNFVGSHHPDLLAVIFKGKAPAFKDYMQVAIDGRTGKIAWQDSIGDLQFASALAYDHNNDGRDEALFSYNFKEQGIYKHKIDIYDFGADAYTNIVAAEKGINLASTPLVQDLDADGKLDLIYSLRRSATNPNADSGMVVKRISNIANVSGWGTAWGGYLGNATDAQYGFSGKNCGSNSPDFSVNKTGISCNGEKDGAINLTLFGLQKPFVVNWHDGVFAEDRTELGAGSYIFRAMNQAGCYTIDTIRLKDPYEITHSAVDNFCPGEGLGIASVSSSGCKCANSGCQFLWNTGGTDHTISELGPGTYTVKITHTDGCVVYDTVKVKDGEPIIDTAYSLDVLCHGDSNGLIDIIPLDTTEFRVKWLEGLKGTDNVLNLDSLKPGNYKAEVRNVLWCFDTLSFTINEPAPLDFEILDYSHIDCHGESTGWILLDGIGGTAPYQYHANKHFAWSDTIENLSAKLYDIWVSDTNGCATDSQKLRLIENSPLVLDISSSPQQATKINGAAWVDVSGGQPPYSYLWDDANEQKTDSITGLRSKTYEVLVTDSLGCTATADVFVDIRVGLEAEQTKEISLFPNPTDGRISLSLSKNYISKKGKIFNAQGKLCHEFELSSQQQINLTHLNAGIYLLRIGTEQLAFVLR